MIKCVTKSFYFSFRISLHSVQFSCSVMSDSLQPHGLGTPGFPVPHQLPRLAQTHVHRVRDTIQPSHSFHWWRVIHELKSHLVGNNLHIFIYYFFHFNCFFSPKACPSIWTCPWWLFKILRGFQDTETLGPDHSD